MCLCESCAPFNEFIYNAVRLVRKSARIPSSLSQPHQNIFSLQLRNRNAAVIISSQLQISITLSLSTLLDFTIFESAIFFQMKTDSCFYLFNLFQQRKKLRKRNFYSFIILPKKINVIRKLFQKEFSKFIPSLCLSFR